MLGGVKGGGESLYSDIQIEQIWTCPGELYGEVKCITGNGHMSLPPLLPCEQNDRQTQLKIYPSPISLAGGN